MKKKKNCNMASPLQKAGHTQQVENITTESLNYITVSLVERGGGGPEGQLQRLIKEGQTATAVLGSTGLPV